MSAGPSTTPENQPAPAVVRVHRMRVARGACWVIVAALAGVAALALFDAAAWLPGWARGLGLAVWFTTIGVMTWRFVVNRLQPDATDGPTPLPREELPGNLQAAVAATLALAGSLAAASFVPGAGEHLKRVAIPWSRPAAAQYRIVVTSGEPVVRRGSVVTLSAYADKLDSAAPVPATAVLASRDRAGTETRLPMIGDGNGAFHATRTAATDFEYRIEIGHAASDWHAVSALDAAEPAEPSSIEVVPPKYAPAATRQTIPGFGPFESFQFGTAEFRLRFTRPVATAFLEWRTDNGPVEVTKLDLTPDRLSGSAALRLKQDGTLKLVSVVESNGKTLRNEVAARVRITPDTPPQFERIAGVSPRPRTARPGASVPIAFTATDDIALGSAALEYVVGADDAKPVAVLVPLTGEARADGRLDFDLTGKGHAGETIRFRLRIADTRQLDDPELKPQETVYPESGWSVIRLDPAAPPLDEQEWLAQRDTLRDALHAALDEIKESREDAGEVRRASAGKSGLTHDQRVRLANARDRLRTVADRLHEAARGTALTPELRALAFRLRNLADVSLRKAGESLDRAATDHPTDRAAALSSAVDSLTDSAQRIDQLLAQNEQLARARLDRKAIGALAADQAELARAVESLSPKELAVRQRELLGRLQKLSESGPLREAADRARHQEFLRLAATAEGLATMIRDHAAAVRQLDAGVRGALLRTIRADQATLATQAAAILAKVEIAARLTGIDAPKAEPFARATDMIAAGNTITTLVELESLVQKLEAVAAALERSAADRADAKVTVRQLAAWQDDLRTRFRAATTGNAANFASLPPATKAAVRAEQAAIRAALTALSLPPGSDTRSPREAALKHLNAAINFLNGTGASADDAMRFSGEALARLADTVPTVPERLTQARGEFARFQQVQDSLLIEFEQAVRGAEAARKLPALAERQRQQVSAFAALDLPGLGVRRVRIASALATAAADMKDGSAADAGAALAWLKREIDRLKLVLDGSPAPDDKVDELARRLNEVARAIAALGPNATARQLELHAAAVAEVGRQWGQLTIPPEAPALFNDADRAVRAAEVAFRDTNPKPAEFLRRAAAAAEAVAKLADRLTGAESDLERIRRLASNRRAAAAVEETRRTTTKQPDPAASDEMIRQLGREIEELTHTRIGFAAQARKKRVLDQYARLKEHTLPDRQIGLHRALAESLDELAALMADVPELAATFDRTPPAPASGDADDFLPSKPLADALRDLARRQSAIRASIIGLPAAVRERTKPADATTKAAPDDPRAIAARLKARGEELTRSTAELAAQLEVAAQSASADNDSRATLVNAVKLVKAAGKDVTDAARKSAAVNALRTCAEKLASLAPKEPTPPDTDPAAARTAEALNRADSAMRRALATLGEKSDPTATNKAMRTAADALGTAAAARVEVASDRK